jgi:hypothetical protein
MNLQLALTSNAPVQRRAAQRTVRCNRLLGIQAAGPFYRFLDLVLFDAHSLEDLSPLIERVGDIRHVELMVGRKRHWHSVELSVSQEVHQETAAKEYLEEGRFTHSPRTLQRVLVSC